MRFCGQRFRILPSLVGFSFFLFWGLRCSSGGCGRGCTVLLAENQLTWSSIRHLPHHQDVVSSSFQQGRENVTRRTGTIISEDSLIVGQAFHLHSCGRADVVQHLRKAGVIRLNCYMARTDVHLGVIGGQLQQRHWRGGRWWGWFRLWAHRIGRRSPAMGPGGSRGCRRPLSHALCGARCGSRCGRGSLGRRGGWGDQRGCGRDRRDSFWPGTPHDRRIHLRGHIVLRDGVAGGESEDTKQRGTKQRGSGGYADLPQCRQSPMPLGAVFIGASFEGESRQYVSLSRVDKGAHPRPPYSAPAPAGCSRSIYVLDYSGFHPLAFFCGSREDLQDFHTDRTNRIDAMAAS